MKAIIIGAGGQARVVFEILSYHKKIKVVAFVDPVLKYEKEKIFGLPVFTPSDIPTLKKKGVSVFVVGIGDNKLRQKRFEETKKSGLKPISAIHPTANIASGVQIGNGTVISIGATIARGATIGSNAIINTAAIVEHDDIIEDNVHLGPGSVLAGKVTIKNCAFIGIGATIKDEITIGANAIIGAGAVVLENIPDNAVAVGVPAKVIKYNK